MSKPADNLELISFSLCPYVQRSVITLKHKKVDFALTFIDLENPPEWFEKISPMGKVPVLKVGTRAVLFESAVINEYVDEITPPSLHSSDPLTKAFERAWIEYGSELLMTNYKMTVADEKGTLDELKAEFFTDLARLENIIDAKGPLFRGTSLSLVDAAYAPLFTRVLLSPTLKKDEFWAKHPKIARWAQTLNELPEVKASVSPGFEKVYIDFCREAGSLLY